MGSITSVFQFFHFLESLVATSCCILNCGFLRGEQESSDKELSALAKRTLQYLNSAAPFDNDHIGGAVTAVLGAATDANWHTRVSALTFLQSLVYRYHSLLIATSLTCT